MRRSWDGKTSLMPSEADYRRQAEALLRTAAAVANPQDREDLMAEASCWHELAAKAAGRASLGAPPSRPAEHPSFLASEDDREDQAPRTDLKGTVTPAKPTKRLALRKALDLRTLFRLG